MRISATATFSGDRCGVTNVRSDRASARGAERGPNPIRCRSSPAKAKTETEDETERDNECPADDRDCDPVHPTPSHSRGGQSPDSEPSICPERNPTTVSGRLLSSASALQGHLPSSASSRWFSVTERAKSLACDQDRG